MPVAALFETEFDTATQLEWGRRLAAARETDLVAFCPPGTEFAGKIDGVETVEVRGERALLVEIAARQISAVLVFRGEAPSAQQMRQRLLQRASCEVLILRIGAASIQEGLRLLVPMARGVHARSALRLARDLASDDGSVTALYVEQDVGIDAELVGRRVLDRLVTGALGSEAGSVERRVVIQDRETRGVVDVIGEGGWDLVLFGASKLTALGQRLRGTVGLRVTRALPDVAICIVRGPAPITGRLRSLIESWALRAVPQLERDQRVSLVERVQSNSHWDFDFVALMSMATGIAAVGLVQSSEPVVIGAMLVAPLMTPILGLGLALVHGNPVLARNAARSVCFGFLTAFSIGFVLGCVHPSFTVPTDAMVARNWPGLLDLIVAFVAGFAGAYATSRPSLFAALPGVAIAAALVPPIATSGLALALGDISLAGGASMLFFTNMVAIILASSLCLWAVGMRAIKPKSRQTVLAGNALVLVVLALGIWFAATPPLAIPKELPAEIESALPDGLRVRSIALDRTGEKTELVVELGGAERPSDVSVREVLRVLDGHRGPWNATRLQWEWEHRAGQ